MANEHFKLTFGLLTLPISIGKSNDEKVGFKRGYKGQLVKMVNVVSDSEKITETKDIKKVVQYGEIENMYDLGDGHFIVVDSKAIKKAVAQNSEEMKVIGIVPSGNYLLPYFEGSHYFMDLTKDKKAKIVPKGNEVIYSILHHLFVEKNEMVIVAYTSRDNLKYGVIYAINGCLMMSVLMTSNLIRPLETTHLVDIKANKEDVKMIDGLLTGMRKEFKTKMLEDYFTPKLDEVIKAKIEGKEIILEIETPTAEASGDLLLALRNQMKK